MTFSDDLYDRFHELHTDAAKAIDGLPPEALDWVPGPETNAIAVLVVHFTGAEGYWIGVAIDEPPERVRDEEFLVRGWTIEQLRQRLQQAGDYTQAGLARLSLADMESMHTSPRNGRQFSAIWAVTHALEHTALHVGHIQLTRQMWEQTTDKHR